MMSNGVNGRLLESKMILAGYKSRKEFARDLGKTEHTVGNLLNGVSRPSHELMNAIYHKLNLTPDEGVAIFFADNLRVTKVGESERA